MKCFYKKILIHYKVINNKIITYNTHLQLMVLYFELDDIFDVNGDALVSFCTA